MYRYIIRRKTDQPEVYIDMIKSAAGKYVSGMPYVMTLIEEVVAEATINGKSVSISHDMGRVIGSSDVVKTTDTDIIYYACPAKSEEYRRFARNKHPEPSRHLSIVINEDASGDYEVTDVWIGRMLPNNQYDASGKESVFWQTHAYAHDTIKVQSKTITTKRPQLVSD
jgi:hypothetical protein